MKLLWLVFGIVLGMVLGYVVFSVAIMATAYATNCIKTACFPIWPFAVLVCLPLAISLFLAIRKAGPTHRRPGFYELRWWSRNSVWVGMALSNLHLDRSFSRSVVDPLARAIAGILPS